MIEEKKRLSNDGHKVIMDNREKLNITGVIDVLSFDEESIACETELGILYIKGENLHVGKLNLDEGELFVEGDIDILEYTTEALGGKGKNSLFGKIFK